MMTSNGKLSPRTLLYILESVIGVPDEAFQAAKFAKGQDPKTHAPVKCAVCQTPTTECCVGCSNVVYFTDLTADRTYYCKKACQEQDWQKHKEECKKTRALVNQQTLQRAATLMQQAFYTFRLMSFDLSFESLKWSENTLVLKEGAYEFFDILADFPHELTFNESQQTKQMLLTMTSCSDTLISFHRVCVLFLKDAGMTKKIEEVTFVPKPGPRAWIFHRGNSTSHATVTSNDLPHCAWRMQLKDGSLWALDLSASQYGHKEYLLPWAQYEDERISHVTSVDPFGKTFSNLHTNNKFPTENLLVENNATTMTQVHFHVQKQMSDVLVDGLAHWFRTENTAPSKLLAKMSKEEFEHNSLNILLTIICLLIEKKEAVAKNGGWIAPA